MDIKLIQARFDESAATIRRTAERLSPRIAQAAEMIISGLRDGHAVFIFGNGGSAADAQHIAAELIGRFMKDRPAMRAEALTTDTSILTAIGNDYGFEHVFSRQLEGKARLGDVAVALSTSGNSPNVLAGLAKARQIGMKTIALTGKGGGKCGPMADVLLDVDSTSSARIQEAHAAIYHILCELVEGELAK